MLQSHLLCIDSGMAWWEGVGAKDRKGRMSVCFLVLFGDSSPGCHVTEDIFIKVERQSRLVSLLLT